MKFSGDIAIAASRDAVFAKMGNPRFFASCVEGVRDLTEIDGSHYTAVMETKIAYLKFKFDVAVEVLRMNPPSEIEAKIEGTPTGVVGRLSARSLARMAEENGTTTVRYEIEAGARPHENLAPLDISASKRHLGWEPRFTIASALEDYVKELAAARGR